jgi:hypothetical protein
MGNAETVLEMIRREVPEVEEVLRFYEELECIYRDSLRAMGYLPFRRVKQVNLAQTSFIIPSKSSITSRH